ncbi:MAG: hypothetical protein UR60_C0001G0002 [Candidatus Moranbacteria bacterium GW2011_GWF2_34_56]|nr:MAG: hypothetical protein UR51_C0029G0002 [Candidatus Moranbacteria bacterium GW2011_GWF1_34_10]KKP65395.1 MAG: hypothetical protein UR60_C0001G0002 [Candidatus Moranbacteria bacterium GW2011_GWF2_34_56]HBI16603.1 hypothetical protein [Candidatus Moranbacteria bacterium]
MKFKNIIMLIIVLILVLFSIVILTKNPSHNRDWELGQEKLAKLEIQDSKIKVINFRDFDWKQNNVAGINYIQKNFDLDKIMGVDVAISHFSEFEGMAHIFIIFRFEDNQNMVISVETRREKGESFSPILGVLREFEIIYVVGSERDIVGLRTDLRKERMHIYPMTSSAKEARELFLLIAKDINNVYDEPIFYNTLFNNCTNVITRRMGDVFDIKFPFTYKIILPGLMHEVFYKLKLIPVDKSLAEIKNYYLIDNNKVNKNSVDYSSQIRKH